MRNENKTNNSKVLWLSRHEMTKDQKDALVHRFGEIEIVQIDRTIENVHDFCTEIDINQFDIVCVVLPTEKLAELREEFDGVLLTAVSERERVGHRVNFDTGKAESIFEFKFKYWVNWKVLKVETELIR